MRLLKKVLLFIVATIVIVLMGAYLLQEKFIFLPSKLPQEYVYEFDHDFEELFIETEDGARLNALHFKQENPRGIIVYYHGNAGDLSRWGEITSYFLQYNYEVLVMDYRTYGKSTGKISEKALYSDAQLFYNKAKELFPEGKIVVYGRSIGTPIAAYVASKNDPKKLILETPFYDFKKLVKDKFPLVPLGLLKYEFPTAHFADDVKCRIVIIHGTDDGIIPFEMGMQLYSVLPEEERNFITVKGGKHNDLITFQEYRLTIYKELL
ncbi:MAG: alpha/beta hydrolase [Bacteroidia bacterium]|nr:alpha/beta hydrolase [Bacteroidia bacterium]MBT8274702.1 alpha/beta hydrolase [Bacteroidia bacterium]NNJ81337.1 alpha/beta hydrolase [Flavobacteriaceae bacterium]NNK55373.1 alpha/beta hydrolase [Flavobacteriaceae bacterium]NNM09219.1 alpha/beta hydrolase [Flavobacteriaceae bacterium]